MTSLTQAQELLNRWREAAGDAYEMSEISWAPNGEWTALCYWHCLEAQSSSADPLTAVREAIKQTPWASVAASDAFESLAENANREISKLCLAEVDVLPAMNPLARIAQLEKSRKSLIAAFDLAHRDRAAARRIYASDEMSFENAKLTAALASRNARIEELESQLSELKAKYDRTRIAHDKDGLALMRYARERDAALARIDKLVEENANLRSADDFKHRTIKRLGRMLSAAGLVATPGLSTADQDLETALARLSELETEVKELEYAGRDLDSMNVRLVKERDAAREQYRGLRAAIVEELRREGRELSADFLDRFPAIEETEGEAK